METGLNPRELDQDTLGRVRRDVEETLGLLERWVEHLDTKIASAFGLGAIIVGVIPAVRRPESTLALVCFAIALTAWVTLVVVAIRALSPSGWRMLRPEKILADGWLGLDPRSYDLYRLEYAADHYNDNLTSFRAKRDAFVLVMIALAIEVIAVTVLAVVV